MATYKVLQDIEAEDKLIGPLTLRQFIYAAIGALFLWLSYILASKGAAFMLVVFLPISAVAGFFAFPWTRDQPTEVWALARIRFLLKSRRRVWNQDGIKELVTITAPKKKTTTYTNGLSQQEVRSRLRALASTVDTRGWAAKSANINIATQVSGVPDSDRLVGPLAPPPKPVDDTDIQAADDILDEENNANAQRLQGMIDQKAKDHREKLMASMRSNDAGKGKPQANDYWFLNQPSSAPAIPNDMVTFGAQVVAPGSSGTATGTTADDEASALAELNAHKTSQNTAYTGHLHTIKPLSEEKVIKTPRVTPAQAAKQPQSSAPAVAQNANAPVTPKDQTAILPLASNNDLSVATIAHEAKRSNDEEVVVKLH